MCRKIGIALLFFYLVCLADLTTAECFFQLGKIDQDAYELQAACLLNPFQSDYFSEYFLATRDLKSIQKAIALEPTRPAFHMYYGLELLSLPKRTRDSDTIAFNEIKKAYELKPYSDQYRKIYEQDARPYLK